MINLYINERHAGSATILDLKGRLRVGGNTIALHKSIRCLILEKKTRIILNLAGVNYFDSCGLGELVASQVSVENQGGKIMLVGVNETLRELLTVTRLLPAFDTYENEADAIQDLTDQVIKTEEPQLALV